jgi:hypothetical protein
MLTWEVFRLSPARTHDVVVVCFQTNDPHASVHEFLMNFEPRQAPNFLLQIKQHRSPLLFAWLRKTIIENSNRQEQHQQQWRHLQHRKPQQHSLVFKVSLELLLLLTLCVPTASAQRVWRPLGAARAALGCGNNTDNNNTNNSGDTWSTASLVNAHLCLKSRDEALVVVVLCPYPKCAGAPVGVVDVSLPQAHISCSAYSRPAQARAENLSDA